MLYAQIINAQKQIIKVSLVDFLGLVFHCKIKFLRSSWFINCISLFFNVIIYLFNLDVVINMVLRCKEQFERTLWDRLHTIWKLLLFFNRLHQSFWKQTGRHISKHPLFKNITKLIYQDLIILSKILSSCLWFLNFTVKLSNNIESDGLERWRLNK